VQELSILIALAGSKSYGTNNAQSDTDYRGVMILPVDNYLSFKKPIEQLDWNEEAINEEGVVYELRKFASLALQCNPNIIECLFSDEQHIVYATEEGRILREHKDLFLSQKAHKSFLGYARSQLKRIKTHKAWIDNPPKKAPLREDFNLPEFKPVSHDQMNAARAFVRKHTEAMVPWLLEADNTHKESFWEGVVWIVAAMMEHHGKGFEKEFNTWVDIESYAEEIVASTLGFDQGFIELLKSEKAYLQTKAHWKQYQNWQKNRNKKRAALEAKFGYDSKHAMHLVRLMRMGEEVLLTGEVSVYREKDRQELIDIRNGLWPFEDLVEWADEKSETINGIVREGRSVLPKEPDYQAVERLVIDLIQMKNDR
jgi:predicted nucleotidyltransferase